MIQLVLWSAVGYNPLQLVGITLDKLVVNQLNYRWLGAHPVPIVDQQWLRRNHDQPWLDDFDQLARYKNQELLTSLLKGNPNLKMMDFCSEIGVAFGSTQLRWFWNLIVGCSTALSPSSYHTAVIRKNRQPTKVSGIWLSSCFCPNGISGQTNR